MPNPIDPTNLGGVSPLGRPTPGDIDPNALGEIIRSNPNLHLQENLALDSVTGTIVLGGHGSSGHLTVADIAGAPIVEAFGIAKGTKEAIIGAGNTGYPGRLTMYDGSRAEVVNVQTAQRTLTFRGTVVVGSDVPGNVSVRAADGSPAVELLCQDTESVIGAGGNGRNGRVTLYRANGTAAVELNAGTGDVVLFNGDCAEEFDVSDDAVPGAVMIVGEDGVLKLACSAYDTRVVGVVAGARVGDGDGRGYLPALVLDHRDTGRRRMPIALLGKTYVLADARTEPIRPGSLLTTSDTPGHAQAVRDKVAALGAVIGKAIGALEAGTGLVPVLVMAR